MKKDQAVTTPAGFTLVELIVVVAIIAILAMVAMPLAQNSIRRSQEIELRRSLRIIRAAIDEYKKFVDENKIEVDEDTHGYPEELQELVEGLEYNDKQNNPKIMKFLRRIPKDPMTGSVEWGLRSYQDDADEDSWGGENVWDVYTKSPKKGFDGSYYKDW